MRLLSIDLFNMQDQKKTKFTKFKTRLKKFYQCELKTFNRILGIK